MKPANVNWAVTEYYPIDSEIKITHYEYLKDAEDYLKEQVAFCSADNWVDGECFNISRYGNGGSSTWYSYNDIKNGALDEPEDD